MMFRFKIFLGSLHWNFFLASLKIKNKILKGGIKAF